MHTHDLDEIESVDYAQLAQLRDQLGLDSVIIYTIAFYASIRIQRLENELAAAKRVDGVLEAIEQLYTLNGS